MKGKVLIYGGSGAVGSETARVLKSKGYDVHLVGSNKEKLEIVAAELNATMSIADVLDVSSFERVSKEAGDELVGLIYAVGTINLKSLMRLDETDFMNDFQINALGAALAVKSSITALKKGGGSIVLYSSVAVGQGLPMHSSISMAKGAVEGLVRSLSAELAPTVRVNGIAPSIFTDSNLSLPILKDQNRIDANASRHALKRLGNPNDIAQLTAFLISKDSNWITGQIIGVDGGRSVIQV